MVAAMLAALCSPRRSFQLVWEIVGLAAILAATFAATAVSCDLWRTLPLSEWLGPTMLWFLEGFAAFAYKMSEAALLGWGMRENIRLLTMFEVASLA